jgi:hypothetical protein
MSGRMTSSSISAIAMGSRQATNRAVYRASSSLRKTSEARADRSRENMGVSSR